MKMTPVTSSNIAAMSYYEPKKELSVQFKNGKTFCYKDVSEEEKSALFDAESIGKHFNQFIKAVKVGREVLTFNEKALMNDKEKVALLRSALQKISSVDAEFNVSSEVWVIADEALEVTKGGE